MACLQPVKYVSKIISSLQDASEWLTEAELTARFGKSESLHNAPLTASRVIEATILLAHCLSVYKMSLVVHLLIDAILSTAYTFRNGS